MSIRFRKLNIRLVTLVVTAVSVLIGFLPAPVFAQFQDAKDAACQGLTSTGGGCDNGAGVGKLVSAAVNILSVVVGVAAIIMIIIAGFKYVTSGGDASSVSSAKNTLLYAVVGIVIVGLAQFLVRFVFARF